MYKPAGKPPMTTPKQSDDQHQDQVAAREDDLVEADVSIPASFDEVMQAVVDGYGTRPSGHHPV